MKRIIIRTLWDREDGCAYEVDVIREATARTPAH